MKKEQVIQTNRFISQRLALDKFEDAAIAELLSYYNTAKKGVQADIEKAIKNNLNNQSKERLQDLLKEIDGKLLVLTDKMTKSISEAVGEAGEYSYKDTANILSWDGKVEGFNYVALSSAQIAALVSEEKIGGKTLDEWLFSALNVESKAIKADIAAAKIRGTGYKKLMSELSEKYKDIINKPEIKRNLETVVKSYIQTINSKTHRDLYEANKEVVKEVEWSAILENGNTATGKGTCSRCMALDGNTYASVDKGPSCPLHPRCRCMYVPVSFSWKDLGFDIEETNTEYRQWYERSSTRRKVDSGYTDKDFSDFWATKPKYWQDNAIGPVRANLVRDGIVKFQDIVDKDGNLILLDELVGEDDLAKARKQR